MTKYGIIMPDTHVVIIPHYSPMHDCVFDKSVCGSVLRHKSTAVYSTRKDERYSSV